MSRSVRTAVFPAAGLGTRVLPASRGVPKEMLTVVDRPVMQHVVAEAQEAGIERFVFVVAPGKHSIVQHFGDRGSLEALLVSRGRVKDVAAMTRGLPPIDATSFVEQPVPLGLGHAILTARDLIGDEAFAVLLPDVFISAEPGCLSQIMETFRSAGGNVVSVQECRREETSRYGIADPGEPLSENTLRIRKVVEKPTPESAPSTLRLNGRYIFQPEIFAHLARVKPGTGGEIQLSDGISYLSTEQPVIGHRFVGRSFDCGSKEGLIAANVAMALGDPALALIVRREVRAADEARESLGGRNLGS